METTLPADSEKSVDAADPGLQFGVDYPLPSDVAVGKGTAVFVCGWCFAREHRITSAALTLGGEAQPVAYHSMPRVDVFEAFHAEPDSASPEDPNFHSYRSGFWGFVRIPECLELQRRELVLEVRLADGARREASLAKITLEPRTETPLALEAPAPETGPLVAVAMATHNPPLELFREQVESIRAQTHRNWVCVVSDDRSSPEHVAQMEEVLAGDPRFTMSRSPRRLQFYKNFERALALCPAQAQYVAMADQDDRWYPEKLDVLLRELGDAQLVYSDARIVLDDGEVVADTYWQERRNNHEDITSLLVANVVTGAASLFPRELLEYALPFPPRQFSHFHDHWVGLVARCLGEVKFVDRPLYDYTQHGAAVLGHADANRIELLGPRVKGWFRKDPRERVRKWRLHYYVDCCRLAQFTLILEMRCGPRMTRRRHRALTRFRQAERSPIALADLGRRAVTEFFGRPETLGAELPLFLAFAWRRATVASTRGLERPTRRFRLDARPPATLLPKPGRRESSYPAVGQVAAKITPLELAVRDDAPERINLLIPTVDLTHFFGGYIAKFNLARRLAERGARVRIVTVDPVGPLPSSWADRVESYSGLERLFEHVEVAFGREAAALEVSPEDRFIATTWWTAHIAHDAARAVGGEGFLYLIQEYEPFTFPMGTYAALASESYARPHQALFSSELLREYFRRHRIGVFADGEDAGDRRSASFQNAITAVPRPSASELAERSTRRLLFYARPEPHAARNMFELAVLALTQAARDGVFGPEWVLHGIGTVGGERRIELGRGIVLELMPRAEQRSYAELLRDHDVGLALMYTPHPSLVPIEMASAGLLTVTNTFENKTASALTGISSNLVGAEPGLDGITAALADAAARIDDFDRRAAGAVVNWSSDWDTSLDDDLMARVESFLGI
jgi:glycosyltransferase involved in cell wall biosynthesis